MINTIYPCPGSFFPQDWTLGLGLLCYNGMLGQMFRLSDFNVLGFLFMLM